MGNRCLITTPALETGIYLHWHGTRITVEALLAYCECQEFRSPDTDPEYAFARFAQITANWLGGTLSIGITNDSGNWDVDNLDNGVYIIKGWNIIDRVAAPEEEIAYDFDSSGKYSLINYSDQINDLLHQIDARQPAYMQIWKDEENTSFLGRDGYV